MDKAETYFVLWYGKGVEGGGWPSADDGNALLFETLEETRGFAKEHLAKECYEDKDYSIAEVEVKALRHFPLSQTKEKLTLEDRVRRLEEKMGVEDGE